MDGATAFVATVMQAPCSQRTQILLESGEQGVKGVAGFNLVSSRPAGCGDRRLELDLSSISQQIKLSTKPFHSPHRFKHLQNKRMK